MVYATLQIIGRYNGLFAALRSIKMYRNKLTLQFPTQIWGTLTEEDSLVPLGKQRDQNGTSVWPLPVFYEITKNTVSLLHLNSHLIL